MEGAGAPPGDAHCPVTLTPDQWTQCLRVTKYPCDSEESKEFKGQLEPCFVLLMRDTLLITYSPNPLHGNQANMVLPRYCRRSVVSPEHHDKPSLALLPSAVRTIIFRVIASVPSFFPPGYH